MPIIYIDADACPVKDEIYRVAKRYAVRVVVVSKTVIRVPPGPLVVLEVRPDFGEVDDWIAEKAGPNDLVVTSDIPLAARCLEKGARAIGPKGDPFTEGDIGSALAMRELLAGLRQEGVVRGGPAPMTPRDRSRFLSKLDESVNALLRAASKEPRPG